MCADLGSTGLRVFPNDFQKDVPEEKTLAQIAGALKKLAPVAASLGVELRLEAHGSTGLLPNLQTIVQAVGEPGVRVILNSDFRDTKGEVLRDAVRLSEAHRLGRVLHAGSRRQAGQRGALQGDRAVEEALGRADRRGLRRWPEKNGLCR